MAILTFQKPDKVIMIESNDFNGKFEFRPLEPGFGITIGNALRRILLSSLEGFAIKTLKIEGVDHEFSSIEGVVEDVTDIVLNLKQVHFKQQIDEVNSEKITINILGQDVFTAGDLNKFLSSFQVLNPDLVICHLNPSVKLQMEILIDKGRGYVLAEEHTGIDSQEIGLILLDSIYTPIKNVNYWVEDFRVEQKTDFEKLIIEVATDGSITPKDALNEAAKILIQHLLLFSDEKMVLEEEVIDKTQEMDESDIYMRQLLKMKLTDLDLSVRALNCLKAAEVDTLGQLVTYNKSDLLKFRNFGKKSLTELEELISSKKLSFGMDVSRYNLDSE
jgi:DNA-directed RNA polymerase subunit alpha